MKSPVSLAPYFKTDLKHRQCRLVRKRSGARKVGVRGGARNLRPLPVCSPLTLGGGGCGGGCLRELEPPQLGTSTGHTEKGGRRCTEPA